MPEALHTAGDDHFPWLLLASLIGLALGPPMIALSGRWRWLVSTVDGVVLVAMGGLIAAHILPELFEIAGPWVAVAVACGLLLPPVLERLLGRAAQQVHTISLGLALFGLAVHATIDGVALAGGGHDHGGSDSLRIAVVLHRLPVGLTIWWLLRPTFGARVAIGVLLLIATMTVVGFAAAGSIAHVLHGPTLALFNAFVAGTLVHVLLHRPHNH